MIKHAAILKEDKTIVTGKDHAACIHKSVFGACRYPAIQGFVTEDGTFVTRELAGIIAYKAKQLSQNPNGRPIFSEEIWETHDRFNGLCDYDEETGYYLRDK